MLTCFFEKFRAVFSAEYQKNYSAGNIVIMD